MKEMCHCGKPLHYTDNDIKKKVDKMIEALGIHIDVVYMNKTYKVPRHFIALHGLNACDLDSLGFEV
jgi:hypothetical protein